MEIIIYAYERTLIKKDLKNISRDKIKFGQEDFGPAFYVLYNLLILYSMLGTENLSEYLEEL